MKIVVHLKNMSRPREYDQVFNAYEKGRFYCLYLSDGKVHKYPIADIFRTIEEY